MTDQFTHTVICFDDPTKTKSFTNIGAASRYANKLLRQKLDYKIYPFKERRSYGDVLAADGPPPGVKVE